jgi:HD-GYP domain-containing protein (c-di-GMP phosphodiesterase class II)
MTKNEFVRLSINVLKPGMILADSIVNDYDSVVLWQYTELDDAMISHMNVLGIESVVVFTYNLESLRDDREGEWKSGPMYLDRFLHMNRKNKWTFKDIFHELSTGHRLELDVMEIIVDSVLAQNAGNSHIVNCINQVRHIDEYTYSHCVNVSVLAMILGKWMNLDDEQIHDLVRAGLLHDIGKSMVLPRILNKPGKLTDLEYKEMKRHTEYGYLILKAIPNLNPEIAFSALAHHEREDGAGYPLGLKSGRLHLYAKILSIVDIFDAMTANRTYKKHQLAFTVFDMMQNGSLGQLDSNVLRVFLLNISNYYPGKTVILSNHLEGTILFMNLKNYSCPVVQIGEKIVDLTQQKKLSIIGIK